MISKNVMKTGEFDDAIFYRLACVCGSDECDLNLELEHIVEDDCMTQLYIYKTLCWDARYYPVWYKRIWIRIKTAFQVLFTGRIRTETTFIMGEEQMDAFVEVIKEAREKFKK